MRWKSRSLLLAVICLGYVLVAALRAGGGDGFGPLALLSLPIALAVLWQRSAPPPRGEDWVHPETRSAMRLAGFGAALLLAAEQTAPGARFFDGVALTGVALAGVACLTALARITGSGGLLIVPARAQRWHETIFLGLAGLCGVGWTARSTSAGERAAVAVVVALVTLATITAASLRIGRLRRLDLGAAPRLRAAFTMSCVGLVTSSVVAAVGLGAPARALEAIACATSLACIAACILRDPTRVARGQRTLLVLAMFAGPAALFAASVAARAPRDAATIAALALALGVVIGLSALPLARPLGPDSSRLIGGLRAALRASLGSEPNAAITAALSSLHEASGPGSTGPELWCLDPPSVFFVDRAGYGQQRNEPTFPVLALDLCSSEPEHTLRTEVLETLEVRRAEVRPLLAWLRDRDALSLTLLRDGDGTLGALLLPAAGRTEPLTLEEVRELGILSERFSCLLGASAQIARAQAREMVARRLADDAEDCVLRTEHQLAAVHTRTELAARRLGRSAAHAAYSPAARLALDELARLGQLNSPVTLITPVGADPVPFAAHVHVHSARGRGPFVVIDAVAREDRDVTIWRDPATSPLCLADGGSLVVLNITALPAEIQAFLAESLSARRAPGPSPGPLELGLIVSTTSRPELLAASAQLEPSLAERLGAHQVALPPLTARGEDLRALFIDRLARIGMRLSGRPLGLDSKALARLVEHAWPANELELDDVLTRAAAVAEGDVLTTAHLDQIGFVCTPPEEVAAAARRTSRAPHAGAPRTTQVP